MTNEYEQLKNEGLDVTVGGKAFKLKALVYDDYRSLLKEIPMLVMEAATKDPNLDLDDLAKDPMPIIGAFAGDASVRLLKYIAKGIGKEEGFLRKNMTIADMSELLLGFFKVNDLGKVFQNFRELGAEIKRNLPKVEAKKETK